MILQEQEGAVRRDKYFLMEDMRGRARCREWLSVYQTAVKSPCSGVRAYIFVALKVMEFLLTQFHIAFGSLNQIFYSVQKDSTFFSKTIAEL
jgi:hypothetical protein